jgi:hypothetical protein
VKVIDKILYLDLLDAEQCGLGNANYIYKEKSRGAKWGVFVKDPVYKNIVLIEFESLHPKKKELVVKHFGNPYDHYSKDPIRKMVIKDVKAEDFFFNYRYGNNSALPEKIIERYTTAVSWLNMLITAQDDFRTIKKTLCITAAKFWLDVCELIEKDSIDIPSAYARLLKKIKSYRDNGYAEIVHKHYGNKNAAKIDNEVKQALLLTLIAIPNSDDVLTANRFNQWAIQNNEEQITSRTVTNWKLENKAFISSDKYGVKETYNEFGKHIPRRRPSAPLLLVEHDDNELDLYFQKVRKIKVKDRKTGKEKTVTETYYFERFVIAVVIDAYNDYPLGWAYAETYTKDLIRFAYLDAVHHIKDLTGSWHLPHQIRCDHFGLDAQLTNDLAQFYKSLATFTPATVKVARGKYIERSFGKQWHQALGQYKNYAGNNLTSKTHVPQDFIEANKRNYPSVEQAPSQIAHFINILRHLINEKTGLSRQEQWLKAFAESEKSKQYAITEEVMLSKLGSSHAYSNKITNRGITPAINGIERIYEIPEHLYLNTIGKTVQVVYDPMDYSRILVTDNDGLRFIAREIELMPSAIADFEPGDRKRLNDRLEQKVRFNQTISDVRNGMNQLLDRNRIDAESYMMAGVHSKAINHELQLSVPALNFNNQSAKNQIPAVRAENYDPLDGM